jgi:hypothetical protein
LKVNSDQTRPVASQSSRIRLIFKKPGITNQRNKRWEQLFVEMPTAQAEGSRTPHNDSKIQEKRGFAEIAKSRIGDCAHHAHQGYRTNL